MMMAMVWLVVMLGVLERAAPAEPGYPGPKRGYRGMPDAERDAYYHENGYAWPPGARTTGWPPVVDPAGESASYARSRDELEAWARGYSEFKPRWDEFSTLVQSRLMPAFTPVGFEKRRTPDGLREALAQKYDSEVRQKGLDMMNYEGMSSTAGPDRPKFYHQPELNRRTLAELQPILEEWAGIPLKIGQSYGVRVYQNGSTLVCHVDRSETHVISAIVHIDHDLDEPWPLEIEDHEGNWHAVDLAPGEMCLYESAKMYHARMAPMRGRHYGSVFVHFYPDSERLQAAGAPAWNWTMWDTHVAVPPDFNDDARMRPEVRDAALPPFLRAYHAYWAKRGVEAPRYHRGIDDPVQTFNVQTDSSRQMKNRLDRQAKAAAAAATTAAAATAKLEDETGARLREASARLRDAAASGDVDAVSKWLDKGAEPHAPDENDWHALHEATRAGSVPVVSLLLERGGEHLLGHKTRGGGTALWWARKLHGDDHAIVHFLEERGAPELGDEEL